jgi:phosphonopyruvate decarboxylase
MGCASAIGLGLSLQTKLPLLVLDGDGAALMKLGNLASIGRYAPPNLLHIILDNGVHDSTGGQASNAALVDFCAVAQACAYASAHACDDAPGVAAALEHALASPGPHLIHVRIAPGSLTQAPRPQHSPAAVARRLRAWLAAQEGRE